MPRATTREHWDFSFMCEPESVSSTLKTILPLIGVALGWLLGIGSSFIMIWWKNRELKKALISELFSLHESLKNLHLSYARDLQMFAVGRVERSSPIRVAHAIYENHYKDICYKLNQNQRQSYELVHEHINSFNNSLQEQQAAVTEYALKPSREAAMRWGSIIEAQYVNVRVIHFHITRHLNNKKNPELGLRTAAHKEYLDFLEEIDGDIRKILEKAKTFDPSDATKRYDESYFKHLEDDSSGSSDTE